VNKVGVNATPLPPAPTPSPTPRDSGPGALVLACMQRSVQIKLKGDCTQADYSTASLTQQYYTTGVATAQVFDFCAGSGAPANQIPTFPNNSKKLAGVNFDCTQWTTPNSPGVFVFAIPSEEGSTTFTGDGSNVGVWSDK